MVCAPLFFCSVTQSLCCSKQCTHFSDFSRPAGFALPLTYFEHTYLSDCCDKLGYKQWLRAVLLSSAWITVVIDVVIVTRQALIIHMVCLLL